LRFRRAEGQIEPTGRIQVASTRPLPRELQLGSGLSSARVASVSYKLYNRAFQLSLERNLSTCRLGTDVGEDVPLTVQTGDEHGTSMLFANWLAWRNNRRLVPLWSHVAQGFAEATLTEFIGAAKKFNRIVDAEWSQQELHRPIMLVAQREDVSPHAPRIASAAKQNLRRQPRVFDSIPCRDGLTG
jgi:hypothetical protein